MRAEPPPSGWGNRSQVLAVSDVLSESTAASPSQNKPLGQLDRLLFPIQGAATTIADSAVVFVLGSVIAFLRWGPSSTSGRLWAEDGSIFLQQAHTNGPLRSIWTQYGGYLSVGPRLAAAAVYVFPLSWQGVLLHVAAAVVTGAVAGVAYVATAGHVPPRFARLLIAACVVAVPVGPEVTGNIANLQWFLVFGAIVALFWVPRGRAGWCVLGALIFIAVTSSPFGAVIVAAALIRLAVQRSRASLIIATTSLVALVIQLVAMVEAPSRTDTVDKHPAAARLARGYINRVLGDGVFGVGRFSGPVHTSAVAGLAVFAAGAVLLALIVLARRSSILVFVGPLLVLSFATYLLPVILGSAPVENPFADSRYYVTPSLFLETALIALVGTAVRRVTRSNDSASSRFALGPGVWIARGIAVFIVVSLAFGLSVSYYNGSYGGRNKGETWAGAVAAARHECSGKASNTPVVLPILPAGWFVRLSCAQVR
jgi:hypothetical protein